MVVKHEKKLERDWTRDISYQRQKNNVTMQESFCKKVIHAKEIKRNFFFFDVRYIILAC